MARGRGQKAGIIVLAFIVVLVASRVLASMAMLAFFAGVVVMIVQLFRRRPVKKSAVAAVGSLAMVILFSSIAGAIYGPQNWQGGRAETAEKRAAEPSPPQPEKTQPEKAQPPPPKEPAEKPEANRQPEPDPTEHLVTAVEYHQLGASEDDSSEGDYLDEHILKGGLKDCIDAKYKDMYGGDAWGEVIRGYRTEADSPYGMDAPEVLMIEEGAGCTVQEGIDQLGNWTDWEWRQANKHFKDGL
ncbi:hypothetical protein GBA63_14865 [Rubrobacter tropicus]|uniref:Uncharacterized protein n=1 Tax=Rubrobacter tropicus TaxID=2653851 RepID=A0A6G8QBH0_9ACTN|nr:hypothetical protein GBA63_14865 [Rubrobacter tropicus]